MRSAKASSSAAKPSSRVLVLAARTRSSAASGAGEAPPVRPSTRWCAASTAAFQVASSRSTSGRATSMRPASTSAAQRTEATRKSAAGSIASAMPSPATCAGLRVRFCSSGLSMMTVRAFSTPMRLGRRQQPPQPGTRPMKHSGSENMPAASEIVR